MFIMFVLALALCAWGLFFNRQTAMEKELNLPYFNARNNPLNIRPASDGTWQGQIGVSLNNFSIFEDSTWGFRAAYKNVLTYMRKYGLYTIREIVSKWAPPSDNNPTNAYIKNVSAWTGINPDRALWQGEIPKLLSAMTRQETGKVVTPNQVRRAIKSTGYAI